MDDSYQGEKQLYQAQQEIERLQAEVKKLKTLLSGRTYYHDNEKVERDLVLYQELLQTEQAENEELRGRLNKVALDWQVKENEVAALRNDIKVANESNSRLAFFITGLNKGIEENKARAEIAEEKLNTERDRCVAITLGYQNTVVSSQGMLCRCIARDISDDAEGTVDIVDDAIKLERQRCIDIIEAEEKRVLATQTPDAAPGTFEDSVNRGIRMTVVLFSDLIGKIKEGK